MLSGLDIPVLFVFVVLAVFVYVFFFWTHSSFLFLPFNFPGSAISLPFFMASVQILPPAFAHVYLIPVLF